MVCNTCKRDMATAKGCFKHGYLHDGKVIPAIKNGGVGDWGEGQPDCVCHDCNAKHGEYHHYGCDAERCPVCGGQLISCDCWGDKITVRSCPE